ncbi:ComEC/Rec2 family competence protein [Enterocloster clostridioformis]|uniref:ComEC/Rec2 family competence protein n=1 Tax=Enterocloster clostridioformis TaxID=1531 RepID=UPI0003FD580B|nr:ComEC/Rec2 family competence protein [Enterocloster clostridioformis]
MTKSKNIRILIISILCAISLLLGGCADSSPSLLPDKGSSITAPSGSGLDVHFIDVGQGDSILAESDGHYMLIDAGENDQAGTVISYLKAEGVTKLDYVIGTHPHSDHIGGLDKVIDTFPVDKVFLPPVEHTTKTFEDVLDSIASRGLKITKPKPGDSYDLGNASFTILSPVKDYGKDLNNWSVGIRLTYGDNSFVMCGDAENQAEEDILNSGAVLKADVLKAGHHGSSTSTSNAFLKKVSPSWVVIQCGKGNSYGHPHKETMEKLKKAGCQILRTDEEGTITAFSDGKTITWSTGNGTVRDNSNANSAVNNTADIPDTDNGAAAENESGNSSTLSSYVINTNTGKFHRPDCASATQMKSENRKDVTASRDELVQEGYEPCKQCKP